MFFNRKQTASKKLHPTSTSDEKTVEQSPRERFMKYLDPTTLLPVENSEEAIQREVERRARMRADRSED